jgi:integrase
MELRWDKVRQTVSGHWEAEIGGVGGPQTKTRTSRVIPLSKQAVEAMGPRRDGLVFSEFTQSRLTHSVTNACRKAAIGRVRLHDLRHTWATRFMLQTGNLFKLMAYGGWRSLASVKVYQHLVKTEANELDLPEFHTIPTQKPPFEKISLTVNQ